jgi:hypothetical protein
MTFDDFAGSNATAIKILTGFPDAAGLSAKQYFQSNLFYLRNRIAHWGYVSTSKGNSAQVPNPQPAWIKLKVDGERDAADDLGKPNKL